MLYFVMHYRDLLMPDGIIEQASAKKPHLVVGLLNGKYTLIESYSNFSEADKHFKVLVKERDGKK